jgi:hypothetical protein
VPTTRPFGEFGLSCSTVVLVFEQLKAGAFIDA